MKPLLYISLALILLGTIFVTSSYAQQSRDPKRCTVTDVVTEGVRSDCGSWRPPKSEKVFMPTAVSQRLKVGNVFYFAWDGERWVAEIRDEAILDGPTDPKVIICTVLEPDKAVTCKSEDRAVTHIISGWPDEKLDEWRLVAPYRRDHQDQLIVNPDAPLSIQLLRTGQQVKAKIVNGELIPIRSCDVRLWENVRKYGSWTMPDDCQRWYAEEMRKRKR